VSDKGLDEEAGELAAVPDEACGDDQLLHVGGEQRQLQHSAELHPACRRRRAQQLLKGRDGMGGEGMKTGEQAKQCKLPACAQ